jgi:hypothetical protein
MSPTEVSTKEVEGGSWVLAKQLNPQDSLILPLLPLIEVLSGIE